MRTYDVALWLLWPGIGPGPDYVELVKACDHFTAVQQVMQQYHLACVCRAACAGQGTIRRYWRVVQQVPEEVTT